MEAIYLDNNSSTPIDPAVVDAMLPYLTTHYGNPANGSHPYGRRASAAVERAREQVAAAIAAEPQEIVFTSGATESNNLAVLGVGRRAIERFGYVVTSAVEHHAVLEPCRRLEHESVKVIVLPVDRTGRLDPADVERAIGPRVGIVSVMAANNEVGTLQPVTEVGRVCRKHGVLFHSDAAQALGRVAVNVEVWSVDLLSISAHKVYGPKGVGALYVRSGVASAIMPLLFGGGQERGLRPGTLPVPGIVGFGTACEIAAARFTEESRRIEALTQRLRALLVEGIPDAVVNGHPTEHLPGLLSVGFPGVDGDLLLGTLQGVALSRGSACAAGSPGPSHVLRAMGVPDEVANATLRFGIGRFNCVDDVERAAAIVVQAVRDLMSSTRRTGA